MKLGLISVTWNGWPRVTRRAYLVRQAGYVAVATLYGGVVGFGVWATNPIWHLNNPAGLLGFYSAIAYYMGGRSKNK